MLSENISFAEKFLAEALSEYEGNGTRYEPADRQALIDIINELHDLRTRLTLFMTNLPYLDHRPIDTSIESKTGPVMVADIFEVLEQSKYISPTGPIVHSVAYQSLKKIFENTKLTVIEAQHLLHRESSN